MKSCHQASIRYRARPAEKAHLKSSGQTRAALQNLPRAKVSTGSLWLQLKKRSCMTLPGRDLLKIGNELQPEQQQVYQTWHFGCMPCPPRAGTGPLDKHTCRCAKQYSLTQHLNKQALPGQMLYVNEALSAVTVLRMWRASVSARGGLGKFLPVACSVDVGCVDTVNCQNTPETSSCTNWNLSNEQRTCLPGRCRRHINSFLHSHRRRTSGMQKLQWSA